MLGKGTQRVWAEHVTENQQGMRDVRKLAGPHTSSFLFQSCGHSKLCKTHSDIYRNQDKSKLIITMSMLEMLDFSVRTMKDAQNLPWAPSSQRDLNSTVLQQGLNTNSALVLTPLLSSLEALRGGTSKIPIAG